MEWTTDDSVFIEYWFLWCMMARLMTGLFASEDSASDSLRNKSKSVVVNRWLTDQNITDIYIYIYIQPTGSAMGETCQIPFCLWHLLRHRCWHSQMQKLPRNSSSKCIFRAGIWCLCPWTTRRSERRTNTGRCWLLFVVEGARLQIVSHATTWIVQGWARTQWEQHWCLGSWWDLRRAWSLWLVLYRATAMPVVYTFLYFLLYYKYEICFQ